MGSDLTGTPDSWETGKLVLLGASVSVLPNPGSRYLSVRLQNSSCLRTY